MQKQLQTLLSCAFLALFAFATAPANAQIYSSTLTACTVSADCAADQVCADGGDGNGFLCYDDPLAFPNPDGSGNDGPDNITQYECTTDADCPIFAPNFSCLTNGAAGNDLPAVECRNNGRCGTINQSASEGCEDGNLCLTNENNKCRPTQGGSAFYCAPDDNLPPGNPVDCTDGMECTTDACEASVGCFYEAEPNFTPCSDSGIAGCVAGECIGGACNCTALPVELTNFEASFDSDKIVVSWTTLSELNNALFEIQLSEDGQSFETVTSLAGNGTTASASDYRAEVSPLQLGTNFIRLRQLDFDGAEAFSSVLEINTTVPNGFVLEAAYPNPFNPSTNIRFVTDIEQNVSVTLFNNCGQKVLDVFEGVVAANAMQNVSIDGSSLTSGTYFVRVSAGSQSQIQAITLSK